MMRKLPLLIGIFILGGLLSALPVSGVDAEAAENDMSVTIQTDVALALDKSDPENPVFIGTGNIYATTQDAFSHKFVRVILPDEFIMGTPEGEKKAPSGTKVTYRGSMNARNGFENYKAINGIDGKADTDIYMGQIEVLVPMTDIFYELGAGRYSISVPVTLETYEAYGSYSESLDFKSWDDMIKDKEIRLSSDDSDGTNLYDISRNDMILDIDPSVSTLSALFGDLSYREIVFPAGLKKALAYNNKITPFADSNVRKVIFDKGTAEIPWQIMKDCATLEEAVLPSSVTALSSDCFRNCTSLYKIGIPSGVSIGNNCFTNCKSLQELHITEGISTEAMGRGQGPFYGAGLKKVTIDEGVTTIPDYICAGCEDVTEVYLPASLKTVGTRCFTDMPKLKEITIRSDLQRTEERPEGGCFEDTGVESIIYEDGVTTVADKMFYKGCANTTEISFPDSLVSIGEGAFYGCHVLDKICLPDSVMSIGDEAFCHCSSVKSVILPKSNALMGANCFEGAVSLISINVRGDYRINAFGKLKPPFSNAGLEKIVVDDGVTTIPEHLFEGGCSDLTNLVLPDTLLNIGTRAFRGCTALKEVVIKSDIKVTGDSPFLDGGVEKFVFEDGVTKIDTHLFMNAYEQVRKIYIPKSVTRITSIVLVDTPGTHTIFYEGTEEDWERITGFSYMNTTEIIYSYNDSPAKQNIAGEDEDSEEEVVNEGDEQVSEEKIQDITGDHDEGSDSDETTAENSLMDDTDNDTVQEMVPESVEKSASEMSDTSEFVQGEAVPEVVINDE